jgi:hypothetical protein
MKNIRYSRFRFGHKRAYHPRSVRPPTSKNEAYVQQLLGRWQKCVATEGNYPGGNVSEVAVLLFIFQEYTDFGNFVKLLSIRDLR